MLKRKISYISVIQLFIFVIFSCSSQEYTTAKLAIQQSDFKKAAEWLPKAMAVEPDNPEIPIVLAVEIHAENNQWLEMRKMFDKAMSINPEKEVEVRGAFIKVKESVDNYTDFYWAQEFNLGVEQFKKVQEDPDNKLEYLEIAISHFTNASIINPSDVNTYNTLARCYLDKGENDAAKKAALTSVKVNPESFEANFNTGQILSRIGMKANEILPYYEKAVSLESSNSKLLRELAQIYYELDRKKESIKVFEDAISSEEDKIVKADLYYNLGVIYNGMCNYEEAEKSFDEAFFLNEEDYEAVLGMASVYEGLGDNYLNGGEACGKIFEKDLNSASKWYRKAEKKIKSAMIIDLENKATYKKNLELIRYKRDISDSN